MVKTGLLLGIMVFSLLIMPFADAQQFEKATFQESATIIYNQKFSESVIVSIGFETTSNDEIRISDETIGYPKHKLEFLHPTGYRLYTLYSYT